MPIAAPTTICTANSHETVPERRATAGALHAEQRDHHRDADRIVRARLAFEQRAGPAVDLLAAQHREDHGRVGRRERGPEQHRLGPTQVEDHRVPVSPCRRPSATVPATPSQTTAPAWLPEPPPADVHAAVEQDDDERRGDQALDGAVAGCCRATARGSTRSRRRLGTSPAPARRARRSAGSITTASRNATGDGTSRTRPNSRGVTHPAASSARDQSLRRDRPVSRPRPPRLSRPSRRHRRATRRSSRDDRRTAAGRTAPGWAAISSCCAPGGAAHHRCGISCRDDRAARASRTIFLPRTNHVGVPWLGRSVTSGKAVQIVRDARWSRPPSWPYVTGVRVRLRTGSYPGTPTARGRFGAGQGPPTPAS